MKKFFVIVFFWFFLVQGYGFYGESTGNSTVVGPFFSLYNCQQIAREAARKTEASVMEGKVMFRSTSCWSSEKKKDTP